MTSMYDGCVLVAIHAGQPGFTKKANNAAAQILQDAGATHEEAITATKRLFPGDTVLTPIKNKEAAARELLKGYAAEWDSPYRIMRNRKFMDFTHEYEAIARERQSLIAGFLEDYNRLADEARDLLGDLYDPMDYKPVSVIKNRFHMDIVLGTPSGADWRVALAEEHAALIEQTFESSAQIQMKAALMSHFKRVQEALVIETRDDNKQKQHIRLDDYLENFGGGNRLSSSRFDKVREACRFIRDMNFTDDQEIEDMAKGLEDAVSRYNLETVKNDPTARQDVADSIRTTLEAADFQSKMDAIL